MPFIKKAYDVPSPTPAFLFVMKRFGYSQGQAQRVIAKGRLLIDGKPHLLSGTKIHGRVEIIYFIPDPKGIVPIFQTPDFMIFDKPSGVLVHPNTLVTPYSMLDEIRAIAGDSANATHRIDMETSGLLIASKHKKAERIIKTSFEKKDIKKGYLAWVDGEITDDFTVNKAIKINNDYSKIKHKVLISDDGKPSVTDFSPLLYSTSLDSTLLLCKPKTGRTHQIRVHLFHMKHPILGDPIYGTSFQYATKYLEDRILPQERLIHTGASRLMLHAQTLELKYGNKFLIKSRENFHSQSKLICKITDRKFNKT